MSVILAANLGNRDITLNIGDPASPCWVAFDKGDGGTEAQKFLGCGQEGTRAIATRLAHRFAELQDRVAMPLLEPAIRLTVGAARRIDVLALFATDQPPSAGEYRDWDTIESARLVDRLRDAGRFGDSVARVEIVPVTFNPSEHDRAFTHVGQELARRFPVDGIGHFFATIKGGVPAFNAALREQVVGLYGPRARLIETQEPSREQRLNGQHGTARLVDTWPFRRNAILRVVHALLERHDYAGVQRVLESEAVADATTTAFLQHAVARMNLDFDGARAALRTFGSGQPHQWKLSAGQAWGAQRLEEVAFTADIFLRRGDLIGFLTRVASFVETCRRQLVHAVTGFRIEKTFRVDDIPRAKSSLRGALARRLGDAPHWPASEPLFNTILDWARTTGVPDRAGQISERQGLLGRLGALEKLRNGALHQLHGVSLKDVQRAFPRPEESLPEVARSIVDRVRTVERGEGRPSHLVRNVYDELGQALRERLAAFEPGVVA